MLSTVPKRKTRKPLIINFAPSKLSDEQFENVCRNHADKRIEMTKKGNLIIMPPTYSETGRKNNDLNYHVTHWSKTTKRGVVFDSSTGFTLPNGAKRSPDVSWISSERWESLSQNERNSFAEIAPDFVIELRSSTDKTIDLQAKMIEYIENGVKLGWLIDTVKKRVFVYRANGEVDVFDNPKTLSGENILVDFELDLTEFF